MGLFSRARRAPSRRDRRRFVPAPLDGSSPSARLEPRLVLSAGVRTSAAGRVRRLPGYLAYTPRGVSNDGAYPLVVAFSPEGKARKTLNEWRSAANRNGWVVIVSRKFSNAAFKGSFGFDHRPDFREILEAGYKDPQALSREKARIDAAIARLPVDRSRIILAGFSGGAAFAHDLNAAHPGFASAVIDNSNGEPLVNAPPDQIEGVPTAASFEGSRKQAVFLVGRRDRKFAAQIRETIPAYERWGWQVYFRTFPGRHKVAPPPVYRRALAWLTTRESWR